MTHNYLLTIRLALVTTLLLCSLTPWRHQRSPHKLLPYCGVDRTSLWSSTWFLPPLQMTIAPALAFRATTRIMCATNATKNVPSRSTVAMHHLFFELEPKCDVTSTDQFNCSDEPPISQSYHVQQQRNARLRTLHFARAIADSYALVSAFHGFHRRSSTRHRFLRFRRSHFRIQHSTYRGSIRQTTSTFPRVDCSTSVSLQNYWS